MFSITANVRALKLLFHCTYCYSISSSPNAHCHMKRALLEYFTTLLTLLSRLDFSGLPHVLGYSDEVYEKKISSVHHRAPWKPSRFLPFPEIKREMKFIETWHMHTSFSFGFSCHLQNVSWDDRRLDWKRISFEGSMLFIFYRKKPAIKRLLDCIKSSAVPSHSTGLNFVPKPAIQMAAPGLVSTFNPSSLLLFLSLGSQLRVRQCKKSRDLSGG